MAQDQRVDWLFAAQVTGQNELQRLTLAVGKMREEIDALKTANGGLAVGMANVSRSMGNASAHVQAYRKHLDEQAKAMRNTRQGTQQLGMQINDFATSVATGASPIQAFNQQLGQVGYALSMMEGRAGAVGAFLAGPWGAAITIATMVIGPMIAGLFDMGETAKEAADKTRQLSDAHDRAVDAALDYEMANNRLKESLYGTFDATEANISAEMRAIGVKRQAALAAYNQAKQNWELAKSQAAVNSMLIGTGSAMGATGLGAQTFGRIREWWQGNEATLTEQSKLMTEAVAKISKLEGQTIGKLGEALAPDKGRSRSKRDAKPKISDAAKEAKRMAEAYANEQKKAAQNFLDFTQKLDQADMSQFQKDIASIREKFGQMSLEDQARYAQQFSDALGSADIKQINKDYDDLQKTLNGGLLPAIAKMAEKPTEAMDAIVTRGEELRSSFESVGQTVSDAFQGMLTGATSFKDGMKGIISSVISELWRLYVVQQIVGFFTGTVGPALGFGLPGKAMGGSVGKNQPYMVGERGPELFIPGGSGTIIPNRNLGNGGGGNAFSINVDARGSADPAAVRAQVQQGILEAAPAIIAAAEARTVNGLRRPRLGGVMQ